MRSAALLLAALPLAMADYGVDVSAPVSTDAARCMKANGRDFAIVRAWCSFGGFDGNAPGTVAAFWAGGFAHVDVYAFPCRGQDPAGQINSLVSDLSSHGTKYGQIWLDIETNPSPGCAWAETLDAVNGGFNVTAQGDNCAYVGSLLSAIKAHGIAPGVYASQYMWDSIMGSGCTVGSGAPLWYAHYDGAPNFNDFAPFGGWGHPAMKQYSGTGSLCGVGIDSNWYP